MFEREQTNNTERNEAVDWLEVRRQTVRELVDPIYITIMNLSQLEQQKPNKAEWTTGERLVEEVFLDIINAEQLTVGRHSSNLDIGRQIPGYEPGERFEVVPYRKGMHEVSPTFDDKHNHVIEEPKEYALLCLPFIGDNLLHEPVQRASVRPLHRAEAVGKHVTTWQGAQSEQEKQAQPEAKEAVDWLEVRRQTVRELVEPINKLAHVHALRGDIVEDRPDALHVLLSGIIVAEHLTVGGYSCGHIHPNDRVPGYNKDTLGSKVLYREGEHEPVSTDWGIPSWGEWGRITKVFIGDNLLGEKVQSTTLIPLTKEVLETSAEITRRENERRIRLYERQNKTERLEE